MKEGSGAAVAIKANCSSLPNRNRNKGTHEGVMAWRRARKHQRGAWQQNDAENERVYLEKRIEIST